ncbi:MAG: hypothetical protein AAB621_02205 [Patescibacteria group bacterium]
MKSLTIIPIVLIIIASLALASFAMCHFNSLVHNNCAVGIIENTGCDMALNSIQSALSHINTIEGFSSGIVNAIGISLFSLLLILCLFARSLDIKKLRDAAFNKLARREEEIIVRVHKYLRWLFLHEKRDPHIFYAVA